MFLVLGTPQLLQREGLPFSVHTGNWRRGIPLGPSRNLKRRQGISLHSLSINSQHLGFFRHEKDLDSTHDSHTLRKCFPSMDTGPQRGKFSHPQGPRRTGPTSSLNHVEDAAILVYPARVLRPGQRKLGSARPSDAATVRAGVPQRPTRSYGLFPRCEGVGYLGPCPWPLSR